MGLIILFLIVVIGAGGYKTIKDAWDYFSSGEIGAGIVISIVYPIVALIAGAFLFLLYALIIMLPTFYIFSESRVETVEITNLNAPYQDTQDTTTVVPIVTTGGTSTMIFPSSETVEKIKFTDSTGKKYEADMSDVYFDTHNLSNITAEITYLYIPEGTFRSFWLGGLGDLPHEYTIYLPREEGE